LICPIPAHNLLQFSLPGVLLHGPPGCGKTLIAKATAKETNTHLINLEGWYGESQKLTAAVFTLAVKLQPCIIFIDEIDLFLAPRNTTNDEALAMLKGQFLSWWDGLITDPNCRVIVMGATNRPQDLDRAILRRMPATFHILMPNAMQRMKILNLILENEPVAHDVDVEKLARLTDGFSGSDLRELCRNGSVYRVRDYMKSEAFLDSSKDDPSALRPIMMEDLMLSLNKMWESKCTEDFYP
jgi:SpoVK/Ycf46/Vps4 family AAA+-type ATPase